MKTEHDDLPTAAPGEDRTLTGSPRSSDVAELFLAELQTRRERLRHWISLLSEEARLGGGRIPVVEGSRYKCRAPRRPNAQRHSTAA